GPAVRGRGVRAGQENQTPSGGTRCDSRHNDSRVPVRHRWPACRCGWQRFPGGDRRRETTAIPANERERVTVMDLHFIWFVLLGVLLTGYAILDGFDLGVGILHLAVKK